MFFSIRIILGLALIFLIFKKFNVKNIYNQILNVSTILYFVVVSGHFLLMALKAKRWTILCKNNNLNMKYFSTFKAYTIGFAFGTFTPGKLGDLGKVLLIDAPNSIKKQALIPAIIDRLWDLFILIIISAVFFMIIINTTKTILTIIIICLFFVFILGILLIMIIKNKYNVDLKKYLKNWRSLLSLTVVANIIQYLRWCLLAYTFNLPLLRTACAATIGTLIALFPVSIAGLGTREATLAYLFKINGIKPDIGVAFSLLMFGTYIINAVIGALFLVFSSNRKK